MDKTNLSEEGFEKFEARLLVMLGLDRVTAVNDEILYHAIKLVYTSEICSGIEKTTPIRQLATALTRYAEEYGEGGIA